MNDLFGIEIQETPKNVNPCIQAFGIDPNSRKCKDCFYLYRFKPGANYYLKCELRTLTHGPGSDHRANWDACGKFREKKGRGT